MAYRKGSQTKDDYLADKDRGTVYGNAGLPIMKIARAREGVVHVSLHH